MYTSESPFFRYINETQDEAYFMELLISLTAFTKRSFCGYAYRGIGIDRVDLDFYLWAWHHPASFIEMRLINSASVSREVAEAFVIGIPNNGSIKTIFILHFTEQCKTAIDTRDISDYPQEEEVLVIPGTFFEVTSIKQSSDLTIIELKNIPVSHNAIVKTINELK
jgi:hypothetical protein